MPTSVRPSPASITCPLKNPDDRLSFQEFIYGLAQWLGLLEEEDDSTSVSLSRNQSRRPSLTIGDVDAGGGGGGGDKNKTGGCSSLNPLRPTVTDVYG